MYYYARSDPEIFTAKIRADPPFLYMNNRDDPQI